MDLHNTWGFATGATNTLMQIIAEHPRSGNRVRRELAAIVDMFVLVNLDADRLKTAAVLHCYYRQQQASRARNYSVDERTTRVIRSLIDNHFSALMRAFQRGEFPKRRR